LRTLIIAVIYAFGGILAINSSFDNSKPNAVTGYIIDRKYANGNPKCFVVLGNTGEFAYESISVSGPKYANIAKGTKVNIYVKKGVFNIPWIYSAQ
jgi:hypothetical protein